MLKMLKITMMTRMLRLRLKLKNRDNSRLSKKLSRRKRNKPPKRRQRNKSLRIKKGNAKRIKPKNNLKRTKRMLKVPIRWKIPRQLLQLKTRMTMLS